MYPVLFRIGSVEITSFGAMVALGVLVGLWLLSRELKDAGLPESGLDAAVAGAFGGMVGAKLLWIVEHFGSEPPLDLLLSRGGMSWFGGFAGGLLAGLAVMHWKCLPKVAVLAAAAPALAVGQAIGRIGCFLVGDDYGRASRLPWAVAFPEGLPPTDVPVHPTQLYEAIALVPLAWLLVRWHRRKKPDTLIFGAYLVGAGAIRFAIEFLRVDVRVLGVFSVAHLASLLAVAVGIGLIRRRAQTERPASRRTSPGGHRRS
jgi:phosphatidylglycerol---prolipoprotein diacylglyceryl transferase